MASTLSNWAREFLCEDRVGVVGTVNADGSPHLTTMWCLLADDGTLIMTTLTRNQKVKNLRRDPRITFCVGGKTRSVSFSGEGSIRRYASPMGRYGASGPEQTCLCACWLVRELC